MVPLLCSSWDYNYSLEGLGYKSMLGLDEVRLMQMARISQMNNYRLTGSTLLEAWGKTKLIICMIEIWGRHVMAIIWVFRWLVPQYLHAFFSYSVIRLSSPKLNILIGAGAIVLYIDIIVTVLPGATQDLQTLKCNVSIIDHQLKGSVERGLSLGDLACCPYF